MLKRKYGLWQDQITTKSGKRKYFYGRTKQEVNRKMREFREEQEAGKRFDDVVNEWWEEHEKTITPNTAQGYRAAVSRAKLRFGKQDIASIKPPDINKFIKDFVRQEHVARKTATNQLLICNLIFKYAVAQGYVEANPARDLTVPRGLAHNPRELPTDEEIRAIEANTDHPFGMFALWILYTGCRRGELLGLKWEDVDLEARTVSIKRSVYWISTTPLTKAPKSKAGVRTVALPDALYKHLKPGKGWIFPDDRTGKLMTHGRFQTLWYHYIEDIGVSVTPHQLRHAYATMLYDCGIGIKDAQALLGHAYASTTQDIYTHVREEREKEINSKLLSLKFG